MVVNDSVMRGSMHQKLLQVTAYKFADILSSKAFRVITFVLLARWLDLDIIGIIGIAEGFLAILGFLEFSFISIIYRDDSSGQQSEYFSAAYYFWLLQSLAMLAVAIISGIFMSYHKGSMLVLIAILGQTFSFALTAGMDISRSFFSIDLRQRLVFTVNFLLGLLSSIALIILYYRPSLMLYMLILTINSALGFYLWTSLLVKCFHVHLLPWKESYPLIRRGFAGFAVWNYLNKSSYDTILMVDTFILGIFASYHDVGNYTVALKLTSIFLIVPTLISSVVTVFIKRYGHSDADLLVNHSVKYSFVLSLLQLAVFMLLGKTLLNYILPHGDKNIIFIYALLMNIGVVFLNITRPFQSLILVKGNIKEAFIKVSMPSIIFGLMVYSLLAWGWGAMGTALANISVYAVTAAVSAWYVINRSLLKWRFELISKEERNLINIYRLKAATLYDRQKSNWRIP
jgi:O-antigen/teichoic acid export membrane protein